MDFGLTLGQLYELISHYFLVMLRISAMLHVAPVFGERSVSARLRFCLSLLIAIVLGSSIPDTGIGIYSWAGVGAMARQLLIGAAIGLIVQLLFASVRLAGEIIGMQMGLSFANFFDPSSGNSPVVSRFLNVLVTLLFLTFNGHLWLLAFVAETFNTLPIEASSSLTGGGLYLVKSAGIIFSQGLQLGLPIIALLLCINFILALLNRLTPQLSVFVIGFPLTLSIGMVALFLLIKTLAPFFQNLMEKGFSTLEGLMLILS